MPTQLTPLEKSSFIAIVQAAPYPGGPTEAARLQTILNAYEDVYTAIMRELNLFAANNAYLVQALSVLSSSKLLSVGIYFNRTTASPPTPVVNPALIVNCTFTDGVTITNSSPPSSPPTGQYLAILGPSYVNNIFVSAGSTLNVLYIGPGATVDVLDSSSSSAQVDTLYLPVIKNNPSRLNAAVYGSQINQIKPNDGAFPNGGYFGGYTNDDPNATCVNTVTNISAIATCNSVQLTWTSPGYQSPSVSYLFVNTYWRVQGSKEWILADDSAGYFDGDHGFTFTNLEACAAYEFEVIVTCLNGGQGNPVKIGVTTPACGGSYPTTKTCWIQALIKTTPNPANTQTLCDGTVIPLEYPAGTTLTVGYMQGKQYQALVINNASYQNFPYSTITGSFNAAASTLRTFSNGMVLSWAVTSLGT